jgi:ubiquinone biosynthesis protein UbiJ
LLNRLLAREPWAQERLSRHAGKTVRFVAGRWTVGLALQASGNVAVSDPAIVPDVTLTIPANKLADLPEVLRAGDSAAIAELMHVQGDAGLAHAVSDLAGTLRWDIEDDLARLVGDVAALRLLRAAKSAAAGAQTGAQRLAGNMGEYLSEESRLILGRPAYDEWRARLDASYKRLDALEQRVNRLARRAPSNPAGRT